MLEPAAVHRQLSYSLRMEWGLAGANAIGLECDIAAVVDVLSFTTTLSVAADRGVIVYPYRWRDESAERFADQHRATVAVGRSATGGVSLSPRSVLTADGLDRLVLPSPNGSAICVHLRELVPTVVGVCLRNRSAVAGWLRAQRAENPQLRVAVIAAGEHWPDGSLRPSVEDLWGAGALIDALAPGWDRASPEAQLAQAAYRAAVHGGMNQALADCASGRELIEGGFADDVRIAGELDESRSVPLLRDQAFRSDS